MNLEQRIRGGLERHSDQLLCLSLLVLIVIHPLLDYGPIRRSIQALLTFIPAVLAIGVVAKTKRRVWLPVALLFAALLLAILGAVTSNPALLALEWTALAAFFLLIVAALFSYLQRVHQIANRHLYTAASIYLLLGLLWFALYNIIEVLFPGSFLEGGSHLTHRRTGLLFLQSRDADDGGIWRHRARGRGGTHPRGAGGRRGRPLRRNHGRVARQCA